MSAVKQMQPESVDSRGLVLLLDWMKPGTEYLEELIKCAKLDTSSLLLPAERQTTIDTVSNKTNLPRDLLHTLLFPNWLLISSNNNYSVYLQTVELHIYLAPNADWLVYLHICKVDLKSKGNKSSHWQSLFCGHGQTLICTSCMAMVYHVNKNSRGLFLIFLGGSLIHINVSMAFVHFIYSMVTMATRALMDKL